MPTINELKMFQNYPLELKIWKTKLRIREWVDYYGVDGVYVAFSGGKDSTVLLHLVRELYPNVEAVFVNTGLEYPEIQKFAKSFDNLTVLRPKMRFDEVISKYGYPVISKDVSNALYDARIYKSKQRLMRLNGEGQYPKGSRYNIERWKPLLDVDFIIGDRCCNVMKKKPSHEYSNQTGKVQLVATMAEESRYRQMAWLRLGCNAFNSTNPRSAPISFWTEQDVLAYIKAYNVPIASVYGDIAYDNNGAKYAETLCDCGGKLCTTGCQRTGCIFCGFGAHLDKGESRFERLKRTHPRQYEYCLEGGAYDTDGLWKPKDGLGMKHVFDTLNSIYGKGFIRY